jgi:hypothetical protein
MLLSTGGNQGPETVAEAGSLGQCPPDAQAGWVVGVGVGEKGRFFPFQYI